MSAQHALPTASRSTTLPLDLTPESARSSALLGKSTSVLQISPVMKNQMDSVESVCATSWQLCFDRRPSLTLCFLEPWGLSVTASCSWGPERGDNGRGWGTAVPRAGGSPGGRAAAPLGIVGSLDRGLPTAYLVFYLTAEADLCEYGCTRGP